MAGSLEVTNATTAYGQKAMFIGSASMVPRESAALQKEKATACLYGARVEPTCLPVRSNMRWIWDS